jgi:hypothetical protein
MYSTAYILQLHLHPSGVSESIILLQTELQKMTTPAPPSISITLAIDPPSFSPGAAVELSITAVSHASTSITIFTWPNVFNLKLAQRRANFKCADLDTGTPLFMELTKGPKRAGFSCVRGGGDDQYFLTLEPGQPLKISDSFRLANWPTEGSGDRSITPGHRYAFEVRHGEQVDWWQEGSRGDVLVPPGQSGPLGEASGGPIVLNTGGLVEFTILPHS